jgi:hypothetical protein
MKRLLPLAALAALGVGCATERTLVLRDPARGEEFAVDVDRGYFAEGDTGEIQVVLLDRPGGDTSLRNLLFLKLYWTQRKPAVGGADSANATLVWSVSGDDREPVLLYDGVGPAYFERDGNVATVRLENIALRVRSDRPTNSGIDRGLLRGRVTLKRDARRVRELLSAFSAPATQPAPPDTAPPPRQSQP